MEPFVYLFEALAKPSTNKQYSTPVWRQCGMHGTPNKVMNVVSILVLLKFARFRRRIRRKHFHLICSTGACKSASSPISTKIKNVFQKWLWSIEKKDSLAFARFETTAKKDGIMIANRIKNVIFATIKQINYGTDSNDHPHG